MAFIIGALFGGVMGGNKKQLENRNTVKNKISSMIENYTTNINKVTDDVTNSTLNKLAQKNVTQLQSLCGATNSYEESGCFMVDTNIVVNQNLNISCISAMMSKIENDDTWQKDFASTLNNEFASMTQNASEVINDMKAKSYLEDSQRNEDFGGMMANILDTIKDTFKAIAGGENDEANINEIFNELETHFKNQVYNENDIKTFLKNISENDVSKTNINGCKLDTTALNNLKIDNCNYLNVNREFNQNSSIKSLQECAEGVINNTLLTDSTVIDSFNKIKNETKSDSKASSKMDTDTKLIKQEINSGSLASMFGIDINKIMTIIFIIIGIIAVVVVITVIMKSIGSRNNDETDINDNPIEGDTDINGNPIDGDTNLAEDD